jgi:hypothetical protein
MRYRSGSVLGIAFLLLGLLSLAAYAEDTVIRGTNFHHNYAWQSSKVGDVEGHIIGAYENKGVSIYDDGTRADLTVIRTIDRTQGVGTLKYEGESQKTAEGSVSAGRYVSCTGTGHFGGVRCEGTWKGKLQGKSLHVVDWTIHLASGQ